MTYLHAIQKVILDVAGLESVGQLTRIYIFLIIVKFIPLL